MSDNIDLSAIEAAYMTMSQADLGRQRQEELPLSDKERRGPSFAPTGRNGTSHYSPQLKDNLRNKWSAMAVPIQDAESEQVEGLANDDARPWAKKIAKAFMASNTVTSAPPRVAQVSQGTKSKTSKVRFSFSEPVGRLGGLVPPGVLSGVKPSSRDSMPRVVENPRVKLPPSPASFQVKPGSNMPAKMQQHQQPPGNQGLLAVQAIVASTASTAQKKSTTFVPPAGPVADLHPPQPGTHPGDAPVPDYVLCKGKCVIKPVQEQTNFKAEFAMKIEANTNCAYLVLSAPGKGERVHNVLELDPPVMKDGYCHVTSGQGQGSANYSVKLPDADLTSKFKLYLDNLRLAAIRQQSMPVAATVLHSQKSSAAEPVIKTQAAYTQLDPTESGSSQQIVSSAKTVASNKVIITPSSPGRPHEITAEPSKTSAPASLVDISDKPPVADKSINKGDVSGMSIEDAAEHLHSLVQRIIPEITGHGLRMDDATIDDIEETAIDFWLNRGFLGSESDDMKAELLELLRLLARIKRKAELRRSAAQQRCPSMELKQLGSGKTTTARIQYTSAEIQRLEDKASPRPKRLEKVGISLKPVSKAPKTPAKAPNFQLSEIRKWVEGNANPKKTPVQASQVSLASANGLPASSIATQPPMTAPFTAAQGDSTTPSVATQPPMVTSLDAAQSRVQMRLAALEPQLKQPAASTTPGGAGQPVVFKPAVKGLSSSRWAH
ncbi:hypothetical protein TOPH_09030 [Tolypocladium ophioglossoides CBS 100239]|uniref:Uncharacterized protein n=1 Tax=Tolypocladium ophioglossoides (strain CBS 100239) TaxID=1163406 RepID=A0A0L0MXZ1_TOLOC|nr:hypothetical protein TOPH_09030 [Tolypocladium ophioglossoides CBS 100239]